MNTFYKACLALCIVGAINWLLVGVFRYDLVAGLLGGQTAAASRVVYTLVGLSGLGCLGALFQKNMA